MVRAARVAPEKRCIPACLPRLLQNRDATREVAMANRRQHQPKTRQPDTAADLAEALEREWLRVWPDDNRHPILTSLRTAYLLRLVRLAFTADRNKANRTVNELLEIGRWIFEPVRGSPDLRGIRTAILTFGGDERVTPPHLSTILRGAGLPEELVMRLIFALAEPVRRRGRTRLNALRTIGALETREKNPGISWQQLAIKCCDCREARHSTACRDRMRTAIRELKKLLKKYDVRTTPL